MIGVTGTPDGGEGSVYVGSGGAGDVSRYEGGGGDTLRDERLRPCMRVTALVELGCAVGCDAGVT